MWSTIFKIEDLEYDAVPNCWLLNDGQCRYPDKGSATVVKFAKECKEVEEDWLIVNISLVKKDYIDFERCMKYAVRLQGGKRSVTESENEMRGRGKMVCLKKWKKSTSDEESDDRSIPLNQTKKVQKPNPPGLSISGCGTLGPKPPGLPTNGCSTLGPNSAMQQPTVSPLRCKIKKVHLCSFSTRQPLTVETLGQTLCGISRSVTILRSALEKSHSEVMSMLQDLKDGNAPLPAAINVEEICREEGLDDNIKATFPIQAIEGFDELEGKLKDENFRSSVAKVVLSIGSDSSTYSRAITSTLRFCVGHNLAPMFSWKGQKRHYKTKLPFSGTRFCRFLTNCFMNKWEIKKEQVEKTMAAWLSQSEVKRKQSAVSSSLTAAGDGQAEENEADMEVEVNPSTSIPI